mmetsp:Transcript_18906/g.60378  ORF Transcript_18906/g.60378 Transcript_18906/m.60378 type:complete len:176 (-) Transcript_18906:1140-1667(-)
MRPWDLDLHRLILRRCERRCPTLGGTSFRSIGRRVAILSARSLRELMLWLSYCQRYRLLRKPEPPMTEVGLLRGAAGGRLGMGARLKVGACLIMPWTTRRVEPFDGTESSLAHPGVVVRCIFLEEAEIGCVYEPRVDGAYSLRGESEHPTTPEGRAIAEQIGWEIFDAHVCRQRA